MTEEDREILNPRGKRLAYSNFFGGWMHRADCRKLVVEFKRNCAKRGMHMNYDGKKNRCGWSILLERNNRIENVLIPIAVASGINADIFIDELLDKFLENIEVKYTKNGLAKEIDTFRRDTIDKTVVKLVKT